jgi:hypothetical protein
METQTVNIENFVVQNVYQDGLRGGTGASVANFLKWRALIDFINTKVENPDASHLRGKDYACYYGINNGLRFSSSYRFDDIPVISLDDAFNRLKLEIEDEDEFCFDYKHNLQRFDDTTEVTCSNSDYYGDRVADEDSVEVHINYGGGIAVLSECSTDVYDRWFVTEYASEYDLRYSQYNNAYVCEHDDGVHFGVIDRYGNTGWFYGDDYIFTEDTNRYFANDVIAEANGVSYNDSDGEYYEESNSVSANNASYHSQHRSWKCDPDKAKFRVGFEIEKEDDDAGMIHYSDLYDEVQWCKENDGSLDSDGYELVSPTFDLFDGKLDEDIENSRKLRTLINGNYSSNCGGHINLSARDFNPRQLFEGLVGFSPLLYALYEHRLEGGYCKAKMKHQYYDADKYSAIYIKNFLVEFRIFPAVRSVKNLLWRRDLIRIMCKNINADEISVLKMMTNQSSELYKHLRKIFTQEEVLAKVTQFIKFADEYGNKKIYPPQTRIDKLKKKKDNLPDADGTSNELGA